MLAPNFCILIFFESFPPRLAQSLEQEAILLTAANRDPEKIGTDMVKGIAVADEDSMEDQLLPQLGCGEVEGWMQLDQ